MASGHRGRWLLFTGIMTSLLLDHAVLSADAVLPFAVPTKTEPPPIPENDTGGDKQLVKRFVGSVARLGSLPDSYHGKRVHSIEPEDQSEEDLSWNDEELETVKRFLGSVARQGGVPLRRGSPDSQEDFDGKESDEKRYLGSLARDGDLRHFASKGRRFSSSSLYDGPLEDKRHIGSLARGGERSLGYHMYGKRFLGALARENSMPYRYKRSLGEGFFPGAFPPVLDDYSQENEDNDDSYFMDGDDEDEGDALLIPTKRHIGSVARLGWLPYLRAQRRPVPINSEEDNHQRFLDTHPSRSLSPQDLLTWLRQEELERANQQQQLIDASQGKRTVSSLARGGEYASRYRIGRSTPDFLQLQERNAPPFTRMLQFRGKRVRSMRAPHAFLSRYDVSEEWPRNKRSISSIARQGVLKPSANNAAEKRCAEDENSALCELSEVQGQEEEKRFVGSLARSQMLPMTPQEDKRYVGSLAKNHMMPMAAEEKRHIGSLAKSQMFPTTDENKRHIGSLVRSQMPPAIAEDKRHVGSLARSQMLPMSSGDKRHVGSLARSQMLPTTAEDKRYVGSLARSQMLPMPAEEKRFVGSLARSQMLPMHAGDKRYLGSLARNQLFSMPHEDKRYVGSLARSQMLPMSNGDKRHVGSLARTHMFPMPAEDKRHVGSLARSQMLPMTAEEKRHVGALARNDMLPLMSGNKRHVGSLARNHMFPTMPDEDKRNLVENYENQDSYDAVWPSTSDEFSSEELPEAEERESGLPYSDTVF